MILQAASNLLRNSRHLATPLVSTRGFIKDVYKELNYSAPFQEQEKALILSRINASQNPEALNALGVNKIFAVHIIRHLQEKGSFEVLEQVLDVNKMDPEKLERVSRAILRKAAAATAAAASAASAGEDTPGLNLIAKLLKHVRPAISDDHWSSVKTICGLKFNLNSLSFAVLDRHSRNVLQWSSIQPLFSFAKNSRMSFEHHKVYSRAAEVCRCLPRSDLYVFEEAPSIVVPRDSVLFPKIHHLLFQTSLVAGLNGGDDNRVFCSNALVLDTLFDLRVGLERTALQSKLEGIVKRNALGCNFSIRAASPAEEEEIWKPFYDLSISRPVKEQMGAAMLLPIALCHLRGP